MRDAGCGPAPPRPHRRDRAAHRRGARLRGILGPLSDRRARAPIERAGVCRGVLRGQGKGCAVLLAAGASRFGLAWVALCGALAIHVVDEALTDFLSVYNPAVRAIRARFPFLPLPTFTFPVWLGGLITATVLLFALSPAAFREDPGMRPAAYAFGVVMAGNGLLRSEEHTAQLQS